MTVSLTSEVLADLRKKAEAATQGEWHLNGKECGAPETVESPVGPIACTDLSNDRLGRQQERQNADHIAAANPAVVIALLDRIETLEKFKRMADAATDERIREDNARERAGCRCGERE